MTKTSYTPRSALKLAAHCADEVSIAPGGQIAIHDHFKKPGLVWTTSGIVQESRPGFSKDYPATLKEAILEDEKTIHWFRNTTDKMASFMVCDIVPSE